MRSLSATVAITLLLSLWGGEVNSQAKNEISARQEKEYRKVEIINIPIDVLKQVSDRYSGYSLTQAFVSEDSEYKVVLSKENNVITALYKATGEFVKELE